jgi:uncharacterized protein
MPLDTIHAGLGWPVALSLFGLSLVSSFITVAFGIGGGAVMLAFMAIALPASAIIPVHGLVQLGSNTGRGILMARHMRFELFGPFAIGAVVGVATGGALVAQLPPAWIQIGVGGFILWSVLARPPGFLRRSGLVTGGFSSFLTMFFGGTGPFVATYVRAQNLDRYEFVGTHAMLMTLQHLLKTLVFGYLGFAFSRWAALIALIVLFGFVGTMLGKHVLTRMDEKRFRFALNFILVALALRLVYAGISGLLPGGEITSGTG